MLRSRVLCSPAPGKLRLPDVFQLVDHTTNGFGQRPPFVRKQGKTGGGPNLLYGFINGQVVSHELNAGNVPLEGRDAPVNLAGGPGAFPV